MTSLRITGTGIVVIDEKVKEIKKQKSLLWDQQMFKLNLRAIHQKRGLYLHVFT